MMKNYEYMLSHTSLTPINKVENILKNNNIDYVKDCEKDEDITIFSIYYNDFSDCKNSQEIADKLENLAIKYNM